MQKEMKSSLELTIAKLELKQLEVIDKLSIRPNSEYVIRCITSPDSSEFIAVNGDWKKVVGWEESDCVGKTLYDFMPSYEITRAKLESTKLLLTSEFDSFICDLMGKDGSAISVDWKAKHFPEINATVSIGRVARK